MTCDATIPCNLDRIATAIEQGWLSDFVPNVVSTLVGAGIAAFVTWLVFRGERKERYRTGLVNAAESLSIELARLADEFSKYRAKTMIVRTRRMDEDFEPIMKPDGTNVDVGLEMLVARTRGQDKVTARQVREVAYRLRFIGDAEWARREYATLRRVLIEWASTSVSNSVTRESLAIIHDRRAMKEENPDISDKELPFAPVRYQSVLVG